MKKPQRHSAEIVSSARCFVERGVRFVQLYHGSGSRWDAHAGIEKNHDTLCRSSDRPIAGLLTDLKQRGLLDSTLVIWGGEFGRTPMSEKGDGRDHNPYGFTMWMAGGGVRGGQTIGATDEIGLHAVEERLHVHDLHATILHLLGLNHWDLVYHHQGRPERATQNEGKVCQKNLCVNGVAFPDIDIDIDIQLRSSNTHGFRTCEFPYVNLERLLRYYSPRERKPPIATHRRDPRRWPSPYYKR